jgi:type IX secretion system PorP/SprF family membrane protein
MRKTFKIAITAVFTAISFSLVSQQQSLNTNYLFNNYAYNPAVAGAKPYVQANMSYRNQWTGFEGAPRTYMMSLYGPLKKAKNVGLGGMIVSDQTGLIGSTSGYLTFAYQVRMNKKVRLGLGVSAGVKQFRVKLYDVKAYDQGDEYLTGTTLNANVFDSNAGIYLHGERFFLGISSMNMLNNKITWKNATGRLIPHYYAVIGYNFKLGKDFAAQPSVLYKYTDPIPYQMEYNLKLTYKEMVWIGGNYRDNDAVGFMFGVTIIKKLNIAYAYDYSLTALKRYHQGSHEICLNYNFIKKKPPVNPDEEEFNIKDNSIKQSIKTKKTAPENKGEPK